MPKPDGSTKVCSISPTMRRVSIRPAAVWWAYGQDGLHPEIQTRIRFELERAMRIGSPQIRKAWRYILEAWERPRNDYGRGWYELKASIDLDGWTNALVRDLAFMCRLYLTAARPFDGRPITPL